VHGNCEFGGIQSTALLGIGQKPNTAQDLIRKSRALEDLLGNFA
jgi:hypothetical protein